MSHKQSYTTFFSANSIRCSNCTGTGHTSKQCPKPITSYGVVLFRLAGWNQADALLMAGSLTGLEGAMKSLQVLLIQRRDSIGFVEMMRGKYRVSETDYILQHLRGMTQEERDKILKIPFDILWEELWGPPQEGTHAYRHEKEQARGKLETLRTGAPSLEELIAQAGPPPATPEWGFPKGRRDSNESEFACAMREMWEETNIDEKDVHIIRGLEPLEEIFVGSNHVTYLHKYYLGYAPPGTGEEGFAAALAANEHIRREVGDIRWCSLEEALTLIQTPEKRKILLRTQALLQKFCPLGLGSGVGASRRRGESGSAK